MTPRPKKTTPLKDTIATVRVDEETRQQMIALRERDGMPFSVQIRRALEQFLESKGVRRKRQKSV
jgi:hypothetical protein